MELLVFQWPLLDSLMQMGKSILRVQMELGPLILLIRPFSSLLRFAKENFLNYCPVIFFYGGIEKYIAQDALSLLGCFFPAIWLVVQGQTQFTYPKEVKGVGVTSWNIF